MGMRFRRRISIIPGVRLNVGMRGISASIGPRGASLTAGAQGLHANLGLPGTGLSFRQRIGTQAVSRRTSGHTLKDLRARERAVEVAAARAEHQLQSAVLDELAAILQSRVRERYDWDTRWAPRGPYPTSEFVPPARNWSADTEAAIVRAAAPVLRLAVPAAFIAAIALAVGGIAIRVGSAVLLAATALWTYHALQARQRMLVERLDQLEAEYQDDVNSLRQTHDAREHVAREEWLEQERARERIRTSIDRQDLEALTLVLDDELQNEALPIECVFDVDMENVEVMTLSLVLPSIDAIPEHRTALTARGKLSTRAMSQRDRVGLYSDVCTGLALRLLCEIFRVLPCVQEVTVYGELMRTNPATGFAELVRPLHIHTSRADVAALNLDAVDSSTAFSGLGGKFACDRRGDVKNVSD